MKLNNMVFAGLLAAAPLLALGQTTTGAKSDVVGYVTETIRPGFNLIGITLHNRKEVSSTFTGVSGTTLTDSSTNFSSLSGTYILEITSGTAAGTIQEISSFTTNAFTTPQDLSSEVSIGDSYALRKASTLGDIFGTGDDVVINKGTAETGDLVYIPSSTGFDVYHHTKDSGFGTGQWTGVSPAAGDETLPLVYTDALFVENRGTASYDLVIEGAVKSTSTIIPAVGTFSYIANPYPAGTTLNSSNLASVIKKGTAETGDLVYLPNTSGGFDLYHHTEDSGFGTGQWTAVSPAIGDGDTELEGGFIIQKRGSSFEANSAAPSL